MAATVLMMLPVIVLLLARRSCVEGLTLTGVEG